MDIRKCGAWVSISVVYTLCQMQPFFNSTSLGNPAILTYLISASGILTNGALNLSLHPMRIFPSISFGLGLVVGGAIMWTVGKSSQEVGVQPGGQLKVVSEESATRKPQSHDIPTTADIFPTGPLADQAFWKALGQGGAVRAAALKDKVAEILSSPLRYSRRRWFAALLENYQAGDLPAIHDGMIAQEKVGGRFNKEYEQMMERGAEVEGEVVLNLIKKESGKNGAPTHDWQARCMADWSASDKAGAVAWWNELPDGSLREFLAGSLIEGIASNSPQDAWAAALLFDPNQRANVAPSLVKEFARERGLEGSFQWLAGLGPEEAGAKSNALVEMVDYMHNIDFARQSKLLEPFAGENWAANCPAFRRMARNWAQANGEAAAAWAGSLPEASRQQALPEVIKKWASKETASAGEWIEGQKDAADFANLAGTFLQQLRNDQSPLFAEWSARFGQPVNAEIPFAPRR